METVDYRHRCGHSQAYVPGSREHLAGQGELCPKCKETFPVESISAMPRNPFMFGDHGQAQTGESTPVRPPLGLKPRKFWLEDRARDVCDAVRRHLDAGMVPPGKWTAELDALCSELEAASVESADSNGKDDQ